MGKDTNHGFLVNQGNFVKDLEISLFKTIVVKVFASVFMAGCSYWHFKRGLSSLKFKRENSLAQGCCRIRILTKAKSHQVFKKMPVKAMIESKFQTTMAKFHNNKKAVNGKIGKLLFKHGYAGCNQLS